MRIVAGSARGRKLLTPSGMDIRPTTDRVKEALFSILQFDLPGRTVLDLFAGTGQLGLEALSRGAAYAVFTDASKKSLDLVKKNISLTGFDANSKTLLTDAFSFLSSTDQTFDLVLMDPPYDHGLCQKAAQLLPRVLRPGAIVVCETHADETLPDAVGPLTAVKEYRYSAVKLTVYRTPATEE